MTIDLVVNLYSGFHMEGELRMVNRLSAGVNQGVIVSIGSYRGQMDCALAMHAQVPVYCIDPHTPSDGYPFGDEDRVEWAKNCLAMNVMAKLRPINLPSLTVAKVWQEPIGFLWIDGSHQDAKADLDAWLPFVLPNGLVGFHDTNADIVQQAFKGHDDLVEVEACDLTTVFRKRVPPYERYEYNGRTCYVRTDHYGSVDKHAVQEVQTYPLPDFMLNTDFSLNTVIDAGAMIGAFTNWIQTLHPEAKIIAIEPEPGNYALAGWNVSKNVLLLNGVLAYDTTRDTLIVDPKNSGGHELVKASDVKAGQVTVTPLAHWRLEDLMQREFERIDLLKLDIEGSEMDVLLNAGDYTLRRVRYIVGERHVTHEEFLPVLNRLVDLGFAVSDNPHPELSVPPWNMANRGVFRADNLNWPELPPLPDEPPTLAEVERAWDETQKAMTEDQAAAYDALSETSSDSLKAAGYAKAAKEVRTRKAKR